MRVTIEADFDFYDEDTAVDVERLIDAWTLQMRMSRRLTWWKINYDNPLR